MRALIQAVDAEAAYVPVLVLFDHEEVGSLSARGAWSTLLPDVLERVVRAAGGDREDLRRALADSMVASGDMAHATHPNYPERHEPQHQIAMNGGPVLKINTSLGTRRTLPARPRSCSPASRPTCRCSAS